MPSIVIFGPPLPEEHYGNDHTAEIMRQVMRTDPRDGVKVVQEPEQVVRELAESDTGFAGFQRLSDPTKTVWIRGDSVRYVEDVPMPKQAAAVEGGREGEATS